MPAWRTASRGSLTTDVVVDLTPGTLDRFRPAFRFPHFYVNDGAAVAVARGGLFKVISPENGLKIDVIIPKTDLDRHQLDRVYAHRSG